MQYEDMRKAVLVKKVLNDDRLKQSSEEKRKRLKNRVRLGQLLVSVPKIREPFNADMLVTERPGLPMKYISAGLGTGH